MNFRMFGKVLEKLYVAEIQKVSAAVDRKIVACGVTKLLCESPEIFSGKYQNYWPQLLQALLKFFEMPVDASILPDDHFIEVDDTPTYQTTSAKLNFANTTKSDPLQAQSLTDKQYDTYIPIFFTHVKGVIRQIDLELSEQELKEIIEPKLGYNFEVSLVKRISCKNDKNEIVPTTTIIVTFRGQLLPNRVIIEKIVYELERYVPRVMQCLKCLRYGRISTQCRSEERCQNCGEDHKVES
ncbi:unnamed protein product [Diabrotica balteata]|uniref:Exportin-2 C-terminal domain-containing protein n=1 Tax=Diabrotica balteata TaxID=107213 RepID=A0A9N9T5J4_DIABA|nr:unnamed protein product [Diabrotica balteata]